MERKYSGGIFANSLENRREKIELIVEGQEVIVETDSGARFVFDHLDTTVEMGGASGHMIFLHKDDRTITAFSEEKGFQEELMQSSFAPLLEGLVKKKQTATKRMLGYVFAGLGIVGLLLWLGFILLGNLAEYAIGFLPPEVDQKFGELAGENMDHGGSEVFDAAIVEPVQEIVSILETAVREVDGKDWVFDVHVIDADIENAYALPGGYIVVYTGLLEEMERPEQLAGVLAHEMAHVTERHGLERIIKMVGVAFVVDGLLGDVEGMIALGAEFLSFSTINAYSRDAESEADLKGLAFLQEAQIDPRGLIEFFSKLEEIGGDIDGMIPEWVSTHPDHQVRIQSIEESIDKSIEIDDLGEKIAWKELKDRLD
jgi:Zn-dependent protease with chaperone function